MASDSLSRHRAVIGMQWGDEGKGKVVDLLTPDHDAIVRYNGGANAGHTVVVDGQRFAMHLLPSGILTPGKLGIVGNGVALDPIQMLQELQTAEPNSPDIQKRLFISSRAHVVMPWHKDMDGVLEATLARLAGDRSIGTTRRGIGPCYADRATRSTAIRVGDLVDRRALQHKLELITKVKNVQLGALDPEHQPYDPAALLQEYGEYGERLAPMVTDTTYLLHDLIADGKRLLFEGANATLLDVDHGTFPYVTSSNCSALGIPAGTGLPPSLPCRVTGIMKAYATRVGAGPFPTELTEATGDMLRERGNEYGTTTGRPRRCGWLDLVAVRYTAMINGAAALAVMLFDVLAGFDELKICTAYRVAGTATDRFCPDAGELANVEPVYETFPGFDGDISEIQSIDDLPPAARVYLDRIESFTGLPIEIVSLGPDRSQTCFAEVTAS